jgi:hypothetical protein
MRLFVLALIFMLPPIAAAADPCADLAKMYTQMVAATSYRLVETSPGGPTITTEFVAPDRMHTSGAGESITIGNRQFSKLLGKWYQTESTSPLPRSHPLEMAQAMTAFVDAGTFSKVCSLQNPVDIGMKDGFHAIQLHNPTYGVDGVEYLRPDFLPAKIELTTRGKTFLQTYTDWNMPITIEAPK